VTGSPRQPSATVEVTLTAVATSARASHAR